MKCILFSSEESNNQNSFGNLVLTGIAVSVSFVLCKRIIIEKWRCTVAIFRILLMSTIDRETAISGYEYGNSNAMEVQWNAYWSNFICNLLSHHHQACSLHFWWYGWWPRLTENSRQLYVYIGTLRGSRGGGVPDLELKLGGEIYMIFLSTKNLMKNG